MSIDVVEDQFVFVEKYRPQKIDDCILPKKLKDTFKGFIKQKDFPALLLTGKAGIGKTTVAKALCEEIGVEYIIINGSNEGRTIDTLRTVIRPFASTVPLEGDLKVIIMDEADYMNSQSVQPALRNFIEEYSSVCRFIFTCNYKEKIIEPLHSRCAVIEFKFANEKERQEIKGQFFKRVKAILKNEKKEYEPEAIVMIINKLFPDFRRMLNAIHEYSSAGKITVGMVSDISSTSFKELIEYLKNKKFNELRKWVANNSDIDFVRISRTVFDKSKDVMEESSIPLLVELMGEYNYQAAFAADGEIHAMAFLTEVMAQCKFK